MRKTALLGAAAAAFISTVSAGGAAAQTNAAMPAEEDEAIVVTGRKREERLQDVPISTSVVTAEQMEEAGVATSDDLFRIVPGALTTPFGAEYASDILIRGQGAGRSETSESATGLYRNGAYVAGGAAGGRTFSRMDLFDVQRVEVFRGPQGASFGRNAVGGAVNVVSQMPTDRREVTLRLDASEIEGYDVRLTANTPLAEGWNLRVGGLYQKQQDGFYRNADGTQLDEFEYYGARASMGFQVSPSFDGILMIEGSSEDTPSFTAFAYRPPQDRFNRNLNTIPRVNVDSWTANLQLNWDLGFATFTSNSFLRTRDFMRIDDQDAALTAGSGSNITGIDSTIDVTNNFDFLRWSQELRLVSDQSQNYWWILGAEYVRSEEELDLRQTGANAVVSGNLVRQPDYATIGSADDDSVAAFGLLGWRVMPNLEITGEVRVTNDAKAYTGQTTVLTGPGSPFVRDAIDRTLDFWNTSPVLTLSWIPTENVNAYARIATAYRAGGFNFDSEAANPATQVFDEETVVSYEVGVKTSWFNQRLTFNVAAYWMDASDLQLINRNSLNDRYVFNAADAWIAGVELDGRYFHRFGDGSSFLAIAGMSFNDSEVEEGQVQNGAVFIPLEGLSVPRVRDTTANLFLTYRRPFIAGSELRLSANYGAQWGGYENPQNTEDLQSFEIVDLAAGLRFGNWEASIYARNAFDYVYVVEQFSGAEFLNRPRVVGVRLRTSFGD